MGKRAVIYARVSTNEQADWGYSLQTQREGCRKYAMEHEFSIVADLSDDCSGSVPIMERPGGHELYELIEQEAVDVVLLYTHDRTARDDKVIEYLLFKSYLYERGVELHYSDNGLDPYTMEGNLVGYIKSHQAANERRKIKERTMRGKLAKAKAGKWVGGSYPHGYRKVGTRRDATLEIDEEQAAVVRRIYAMYLGHNGYEPKNMLGIAVALTAEKIPISGRGRKTARGWTQGTVRYILTNSAYIGEFRYAGHIIPLPHLALIDRETFQAAQERRKKNAKVAKRNRKHDYLLAGCYVRCSCGRCMVARSVYGSGKLYLYYACSNQRRRYLYGCTERLVRADLVDRGVWEWVVSLLTDEANLDRGINHMVESHEVELSPKRERLTAIRDLIEEAEQRIRRLATALSEAENDTVADALNVELKALGQQLDGLREEQDRLGAEMERGKLTPEEIETIRRLAAEIRGELDDSDFETKRRVIDMLSLRAKVRNDETGRWLDVTCRIATEPTSLSIETSRLRITTTSAPSRNSSATRTSKRP